MARRPTSGNNWSEEPQYELVNAFIRRTDREGHSACALSAAPKPGVVIPTDAAHVAKSEDGAHLRGRRRERAVLDRALNDARGGLSQVLVLHGEAGIGKSALLDHVESNGSGFRIVRSAGVESEMELAYAGLQQLCAPLLDHLDRLPAPQRNALCTAFGLVAGDAPDRFLVGLAVLNLVADAAEPRPLLCLIDDAQWLDRVSRQTIAFVARRLLAEPIALFIAARETSGDLDLGGLPDLEVGGLDDTEAGRLLDSVVAGPIDRRVRERIIAETHGNPLALLELPRAWTTAELADGFELADEPPLAGRIEQGFRRRLAGLPVETRQLLLTAAAEPLGDVTLLWRAGEVLGLGAEAALAAEADGLIEFGARVQFRHPLVRAAAYRTASPDARRAVHRALADATDPDLDPDRRAWHRAQATAGLDEDVAAELERSADRARARGGLVAAGAFLERAARLTPHPGRRAQRALTAAWAKRDGGALDSASTLLTAAESGPPDALRTAEAEHLRGLIAFDQRRVADAADLLLRAARRLETIDVGLARESYLDALTAAIWASGPDAPDVVERVARAARAAPPARDEGRAIDAVLDALATRFTDGYVVAAPLLIRALATVRDLDDAATDAGRLFSLGGNRVSNIIATEVWDFEAGRTLAKRQVELARRSGALVQLQFALNVLASSEMLAGDLSSAAALIEEERLVADATGNPPIAYTAMLLSALRGEAELASRLIATSRDEAWALGQHRIVTFAEYANAVFHNGHGRHDLARDAARTVFERDVIGGYQILAVAELGEAASRTGDADLVVAALARLAERARVTPTDWALGIEARLQALLGEGEATDQAYRESIERLRRAGVRVEVARSHLLYGEWLRREGRRVEAREQLRTAHDLLVAMGLTAFAERARRELLATGERARPRAAATADALTPQEFQIARLARDGLSNPEIGTHLFLSSRTVEWHLRKVFTKLGVSSRKELRTAVLEVASA